MADSTTGTSNVINSSITSIELESISSLRLKLTSEISNYYDNNTLNRSRKYDINLTYDMLLKNYDWRIKNSIDTILNAPPTTPERLSILESIVPSTHHGYDKVGRPVYIEKTGCIPVNEMISLFTDSEMLHCHIWTMEYSVFRCNENIKLTNNYCETFFQILDLKNMTNEHNKLLNYAQPMTFVDQNNYPERLGVMCVINAPWYFTAIWSIASLWVDERTKSKIRILGSDYTTTLKELIDEGQLPPEYGGSCNGKCGKTPCIKEKASFEVLEALTAVDESTMDLTKLSISAGSNEEIIIEINAGDIISWWIKTESYDLGVQIDYLHESGDSPVINYKRFQTDTIAVQGCYNCKEAGKLRIKMDNSFSYFTSKAVKYLVKHIKF